MSENARTTVYRAGNLRPSGTGKRKRKTPAASSAKGAGGNYQKDDYPATTSSTMLKTLLCFAAAFIVASSAGLFYLGRDSANSSLQDLESIPADLHEHTTHLVAHLPSMRSTTMPDDNSLLHPHRNYFSDEEVARRAAPKQLGRESIPGLGYRALPMRERLGKAQIPVIWQMPPPPAQIRGAVLLFHGCGRRAMSFFYSPEGRAIVESILRADMLVAAFTKRADADGCWLQQGDDEIRDVEDAALAWIARLKVIPGWDERTRELRKGKEQRAILERQKSSGGTIGAAASSSKDAAGVDGEVLPVFAFGASSGGHLVARLASRENRLGLQAINVQVAAPMSTPLSDWRVPTYFSVMSRDWATKKRVRALATGLEAQGVDTHVLETATKKIDRAFFARVFDANKGKGSVGDDWEAIAADEKALAREARRRSGRRGRRKGERVTGGSIAGKRNNRMQGGDRGSLAIESDRGSADVSGARAGEGVLWRGSGVVHPLPKSVSAMCFEELTAYGALSVDGELLFDPRQLEHGVGPLEHMVHGGAMVPYGVSDDLVKIMTEDELKRAQLLWLAEPLNVAWNMHEIFAEGIDQVLRFFLDHGWF